MRRLVIVGNGFDLAHGVKSKYSYFKKYLESKYECSEDDYMFFIDSYTDKDGEECVHEESSSKLMYQLINELDGESWGNFESDLSRLVFDDFLPDPSDYIDDEDDDSYPHFVNVIEDAGNTIYNACTQWEKLFTDWIENSVNKSRFVAKKDIKDLLIADTKILSFNYTTFIERYYGFNDVLHIHNKVGKKLIFGHGEPFKYVDYDYCNEKINADIQNAFIKDTRRQYEMNKVFFDEIDRNTTEVISYGFSFSSVDLYYIRRICDKLSSNAIWYINLYDGESPMEIDNQINALKSCGFKGKIIKKKF